MVTTVNGTILISIELLKKEIKMKTLVLTFGTIIAFISGSTLLSSCGSGSQKEANTSEHHKMDGQHNHDAAIMATTFACPMHPEITGKEGEKCSKCGMDLVASTSNKTSMKAMDKAAVASCPMHPEITGKEGDKCSKCGMALVIQTTDDNHQRQQ